MHFIDIGLHLVNAKEISHVDLRQDETVVVLKNGTELSAGTDADNMYEIYMQLQCKEYGIEQFRRRYYSNGWNDPLIDKPKAKCVLCLVSGTIKNRTYEHAYFIGEYYEGEGWWYEGLSVEDSDKLQCEFWRELPDMPDDYDLF